MDKLDTDHLSKEDKQRLKENNTSWDFARMDEDTLKIVAKAAGISFEMAKRAQEAYMVSKEGPSLDQPIDARDNHYGPSKETFMDFIALDEIEANQASLEEQLEAKERKDILLKLLGTLPPREEKVLRLRFGFETGEPMTLEEVGQIFHVTRERIRQIEEKGLKRLKFKANKLRQQDII